MFSNRILTILLFLVSLSLFACSKPIDSNVVAVRAINDVSKAEDLARRGCGCDQDLLDVLVKLDLDLEAEIVLLDGKNPCGPIIDKIIAIIYAAIDVIATIHISTCNVTVVIKSCVDIIVKIIVSICVGIHKYNLLAVVLIIAKLDACLTAFVKICVQVCPCLHDLLKVALSVKIDILGIFVSLCAFLGIF